MEKQKHIISSNRTILDALKALNDLRSSSMTLFVIDENERMVGSLTDGDIRRALIHGVSLNAIVEGIMYRNFSYLNAWEDIEKLKTFRLKGLTLVPVLYRDGKIKEIIDLSKCKTRLPIDAVLMAGGKGERLRPLTLDCPKPLLKVGSKSIIDRNIENLISNGITNISVTVNYLKEMLISHYAAPINGVHVRCIEEDRFLGTIGAVKMIKKFNHDTILVMNSDLLTDIDYEDFYLHFKEHNATMAAAAIPYTISVPYGIFNLDGREILSVSEKPIFNLYANAGIYLLKKECLDFIPDNRVFNATDLIDILSEKGKKVIRYPLSKLWIDIGTPEEYKKAQEIVKHID